jgi:hypothetical protein
VANTIKGEIEQKKTMFFGEFLISKVILVFGWMKIMDFDLNFNNVYAYAKKIDGVFWIKNAKRCIR